jgi:predicted transcriptional regulator
LLLILGGTFGEERWGQKEVELNRILASFCRQKILLELAKHKELSVMALVRKANSTYDEVNRNVKVLEREGIVMEQHVGRMRFIKLNTQNKNTKVLLDALKRIEQAKNPPRPFFQAVEVIEGNHFSP